MKRSEEGFVRFVVYLEETGLAPRLREICLAHHVTLRDIYNDARGRSAMAARVETWWWLMKHASRSTREIGALFDRDASSVTHAMRRLYAKAEAMGFDVEEASVAQLTKAFADEAYNRQVTNGRSGNTSRRAKRDERDRLDGLGVQVPATRVDRARADRDTLITRTPTRDADDPVEPKTGV